MSKSLNFIDLFDWEKDSDRHYIQVLMQQNNEEEYEWDLWVKQQSKKSAKIIINKPVLNKKKNDIKTNSSSF